MAAKPKSVSLEFAMEKDTKNSVRFEELSDEPVVGKLYVKKTALKAKLGDAEKLTVTIEAQ